VRVTGRTGCSLSLRERVRVRVTGRTGCSLSLRERVRVRVTGRTGCSLSLRERVRVRGNMRLRCRFRSPYVQCFSVTSAPVNVPGGLAATPLATPAPGQENRRFAVPSSYSLRLSGRAPACIHAGYALAARPCAAPRPTGNDSAIFSRTRASLLSRCLNMDLYRCDFLFF